MLDTGCSILVSGDWLIGGVNSAKLVLPGYGTLRRDESNIEGLFDGNCGGCYID
jgi:hypothetical protein